MTTSILSSVNETGNQMVQEELPPQPATRMAATRPAPNSARFQCSRCMHTFEIAADDLTNAKRIHCARCRRSLKLPTSIIQVCLACHTHREYPPETSGRHVRCKQCGSPLSISVLNLQSSRRRRRRSQSPPQESSFLPMLITLCVFMIGMLLCYRIVTTL
ncbi:MAG: hypothetical protein HJJLKODD_00348 [Phycisphaerae bacterium]|nr:hypothetical protein [Phycisphaerae bacterium]